MARLILSMDGLVLKEIPLNKERITIGRKAHNDIQIDNLAIFSVGIRNKEGAKTEAEFVVSPDCREMRL